MEHDEQWKHDGDCNSCRRKNYCSTPCTLSKRRNKAILRGLVVYKMNCMTGGAMAEIIDKICKDYIV